MQSAVRIFGKTAFQNFPTAGCTSGPTEIFLVLVERNESVFVLAAARFELFVPAASQRTRSEWQHEISRENCTRKFSNVVLVKVSCVYTGNEQCSLT